MPKDKMTIPETAVARPVVEWMRDLGWATYEEVSAIAGRADIVGTRGPLVWVVEAKTSLNMQLLGQAKRWLGYAHFVSVAVPKHPSGHSISEGEAFADWFLREYGIGKFESTSWHPINGQTATEKVKAKFRRRVDSDEITRRLHDKMKTIGVAGSRNGGYWTPFRQTCDDLRDHVRRNQGCSLKDAIGSIATHYRTPTSAVQNLRKMIETKVVVGVRMENGRLFAEEPCDA